VSYGHAYQATATVRNVDGAPLAGQPVSLYLRRTGTTVWTLERTGTTDAAGHLAVVVTPPWNAQVLAVDAGGPGLAGSYGAAATLVRYVVSGAMLAPTTVHLGAASVVSGAVLPARPGSTVQLQRYYSGAWHLVRSMVLSSSSRFSLAVTYPRGTWTLRVYKPGDSLLSSATSATLVLHVV
jgi:hypothetical protein